MLSLSVHGLFKQIQGNDDSFRLMLSVAAKGEFQGGFENERIAELTPDPEFARRIARHGFDENKHGRLFTHVLQRRDLTVCDVPADVDYCAMLERAGLGISHARLADDRPLDDDELLAYLVHSRVTEQRAAEEIEVQHAVFRDDPELGRATSTIAYDEVNHLSFCHEELARFTAAGHGPCIRRDLRAAARVEIRVYRDVSKAMVRRMGQILGWSRLQRALMLFGIDAIWGWERLVRWRRMATIAAPDRRDAMGDAHWRGPRATIL